MNERIRVPEVRVIDENGEQVGVLRTREALALARQRNLDLVEVAPNSQPPVCRLLDYGKYRYEQTKKEREARKSQKVITIKEIRLEPKIADHDLKVKAKQARSFLEEGDKVKMTVRFRGRELAHTELGRELLDQLLDLLKDISAIDQPPKMEGKAMTMILSKGNQKPGGGEKSRSAAEPSQKQNHPAEGAAPRPPRENPGVVAPVVPQPTQQA